MKNTVVIVIAIFFLFVMIRGCGGCNVEIVGKTPVDEMIKDMTDIKNFTIILYDMDVEGTFSKTYKHQYQVIKEVDSIPEEKITEWHEVSESFFNKNIDNMGMEIAAKADGKVSKNVAPPGYSNYVGNSQYGQWRTGNDGSSFWEFYGKYAFMSSMFHMFTMPVRRSYWDDYRGGYYGTGRPYYGPKTSSGSYTYGTGSAYNRKTNTKSTWFSKSSNQSFRERVKSRVSRSTSSKRSRSGSRYSSSSRSRSSRSFGK